MVTSPRERSGYETIHFTLSTLSPCGPISFPLSLIPSVLTEASFSLPAAFAAASKTSFPRPADSGAVTTVCAHSALAIKPASAAARNRFARNRVLFITLDCSCEYDYTRGTQEGLRALPCAQRRTATSTGGASLRSQTPKLASLLGWN